LSFSIVKNLSGHSGCSITLCKKDDGCFFVRKVSGDTKYNIRLKKQYIKQSRFKSEGTFSPRIFEHGMIDGLFFFDMEYVRCITMAEYVKTIEIGKINNLVEKLFSTLPITNSSINSRANDIFSKKINGLSKQITTETISVKKALEKLKVFDFSNIPCSQCCGDLTLENILISDNGDIYLIDFLDSFYNSWIIDVAKLLQDLEVHWSYRHSNVDFNAKMRLALVKDYILNNVLKLPNGTLAINQIYHVLLLNMLRIIPYTKDDFTYDFVVKAIEKILGIITTIEEAI